MQCAPDSLTNNGVDEPPAVGVLARVLGSIKNGAYHAHFGNVLGGGDTIYTIALSVFGFSTGETHTHWLNLPGQSQDSERGERAELHVDG